MKTSRLKEYAVKLGYNMILPEEDKSENIYRVTIESDSKEDLSKKIRKIKDSKIFLFVKPLSSEALRYSVQNYHVKSLIVDRKNIRIFSKKSNLNLIKQYGKIVEVQLKNLEIDVIFKIINFNKWIEYPIFSSCATTFNELWSPLEKFSLLVTLGANEGDALKWIYNNPLLLLGRNDATNIY
ncbi:RNase P p30-like protein [Stygiolobus caldivivus]|uniref:RNase P p30-like protein n=1 Tax=Stygiolobus caldivivus TaxID=2824673 RepID=A0A8D5U7F7_9CREN|nr:RNase P p30-like protein [Stygiolobus caldivivus]